MVGRTLALAMTVSASAAHAAVLDFNGAICGVTGDAACSDFAVIGQSYGDGVGVDVSYQWLTGHGNASVGGTSLTFWTSNYSDLTNVAWGGSSDTFGVPEVGIMPLSGYEVRLLSFDLGAWQNQTRSSQVRIYDFDYGSLLYSSGPIVVDGTNHSTFNINSGWSSEGLRIQWGPSGYNVGIDNIAFE
jgi:hypothetical protein